MINQAQINIKGK